jgi:hypothetical protein
MSRRNLREAALRSQMKRQGTDFWPTPTLVIEALISHVLPNLRAGAIRECAGGDGRQAPAIRSSGRPVIKIDVVGASSIDFPSDNPRRLASARYTLHAHPFGHHHRLVRSFAEQRCTVIGPGLAAIIDFLTRFARWFVWRWRSKDRWQTPISLARSRLVIEAVREEHLAVAA